MPDEMLPYGELLTTTMRVATWNTWGRFGPWQERESVLLHYLREADADIVCLQEAWQDDDESQASRFAAELGLHSIDGDGMAYEQDFSGPAVLSRWPIVSHDSLHVGGETQPSSATFARIDGPRGPIDIVSLILTWRLDHSAVRSAHLAEILSWARELNGRFPPLVVCGDFNAVRESDELRAMVGLGPVHAPNMVFYDAMAMRGTGDPSTFTERNPFSAVGLYGNKELDHIFSHWPKAHGAGHPVAASVLGDEPIDGVWASDHFGVISDLLY